MNAIIKIFTCDLFRSVEVLNFEAKPLAFSFSEMASTNTRASQKRKLFNTLGTPVQGIELFEASVVGFLDSVSEITDRKIRSDIVPSYDSYTDYLRNKGIVYSQNVLQGIDEPEFRFISLMKQKGSDHHLIISI